MHRAQALDLYARVDPSDDADFYALPRKVVHLEPGAIEALCTFYSSLLPPGGAVLDLMSSWRSHLPMGFGATGLGMNREEMEDNPQIGELVVHNLNEEPRLPFDSGRFDAVVCSVSVQYLTQPIEVFTDVRRVLKPGAPCAVAFSNRCFVQKAVRVWLGTSDEGHAKLVRMYLERAGLAGVCEHRPETPDDPLWIMTGTA